MSDRQLISGAPVPEDGSHKRLRPDGLQQDYIVLTPEERAKGYKKPVRRSYVHSTCGTLTTMHSALAETYAREPYFYSGTYCTGCGAHFDLDQFSWEPDGEPMDPRKQEDWAKDQERVRQNRETLAKHAQDMAERAEFWRLAKKHFPDKVDGMMELAIVEGATVVHRPISGG